MQSNRKMAPRQAIQSFTRINSFYCRMSLRIAKPTESVFLCAGLCREQCIQLPRPARLFPARKFLFGVQKLQ